MEEAEVKLGLEGWVRFILSKIKDTVRNAIRENKPRRNKEMKPHSHSPDPKQL